MLKFIITKAAYDALSDDMKALYGVGDKDGEFQLQVSGMPAGEDTGPLKRTVETLRNEVKTLKTDKADLQSKIDNFPNVDQIKADHAAQTDKLTKFANNALIDGAALALASKISTAPALMVPHIKSRLDVDFSGDVPTTVIKGADGKASKDLTMDKLAEEFVANKEFSAIIKQSSARGSGAPLVPGNRQPGSGAPAGGNQGDFVASKASGKDLAARIAERKAADQTT